jgi:hypothetical protein
MRIRLTAMVVVVSLAGCGDGDVPSPPTGLTAYGGVVWQFDALLHDTFGNTPVCQGPGRALNFATHPCSPLSDYTPYFHTFSNARDSSFEKTPRHPPDLGNVVPIRVGGDYVRCDKLREDPLIAENGGWLVMLGSGVLPACVKG